MKRTTTSYTCDKCGALDSDPVNWLHCVGVNVDLCEECSHAFTAWLRGYGDADASVRDAVPACFCFDDRGGNCSTVDAVQALTDAWHGVWRKNFALEDDLRKERRQHEETAHQAATAVDALAECERKADAFREERDATRRYVALARAEVPARFGFNEQGGARSMIDAVRVLADAWRRGQR
jgi:hypothetical protein